MYLRYLHISDLHLTGQSREKGGSVEQFNQDMVTSSMLEKIKELVQREKKTFDLIFITGDLAKSGKAEDYEIVKVFCEELLNATGVPRERLFIVPGNHDVDRNKIEKTHLDWWYKFHTVDQITASS